MSTTFSNVRVGEPIRHEQLSVFPLFSEDATPVDYVLASDALGEGTVVVEEVSEAGSVPDLSVTNKSDHRVLFLEGEQLLGAKQNRILNTSLLVAAKSKTTIPVSCVEQGRWRFESAFLGMSDSFSLSKLRYALKASVCDSLKRGVGHRSDQGRVWNEVAESQKEHGVVSGTSAMEDIFETYRSKLTELQKEFGYVSGASGIAVALGKKLVSVDLFDKPATCEKTWERMLSGMLLDSLVASPTVEQPDVNDAETFLGDLTAASWESVKAAGDGDEVRATTEDGVHASALYLTGNLVHASASMAV